MTNKQDNQPLRYGELADTVGFLLRCSYRKSRNLVVPILEEHGLKEAEISALIVIKENPNCSLTDVATAVSAELPVAQRYVINLEQQGYIASRKSKIDRRVTNFTVTTEGLKIHKLLGPLCRAADDTLYEQLGKKELETLIKVLQKISGVS